MENKTQSFLPKFIFLCIITTSIVTTLSFSKYQSTVNGSTSTVKASKPILNVTIAENQEESLVIDCNEENTSVNYNIVVSNTESNVISEVSLKYDVILTLPSTAPNGLTIKMDDKSLTQKGNIYTTENAGQFNPSITNENTHTLTFTADPDIARSCNLEDITITVYAEQID